MSQLADHIVEQLLSARSAGDAKRIAQEVAEEPAGISAVAEVAESSTGMLRAVAMSVLKHVAEVNPGILDGCREVILDIGRPDDPWVTPLLSAQAAALMAWPAEWHERVIQTFEPRLEGSNKLVKAWALRALWPLAEPGSDLEGRLLKVCDDFLGHGGALAASAKIVLKSHKSTH